MERDIFIATAADGRPIQIQVLVGLEANGRFRIGRKELTFPQARRELLDLREELSRDVGLAHFLMVMDTRGERHRNLTADSWNELSKLADELETWASPCGISNFTQ